MYVETLNPHIVQYRLYLIWRWHGQEASEALDDHFFFTSDQNTALIDRKLMASKHYDFKI